MFIMCKYFKIRSLYLLSLASERGDISEYMTRTKKKGIIILKQKKIVLNQLKKLTIYKLSERIKRTSFLY